jgi:hypothetical protein
MKPMLSAKTLKYILMALCVAVAFAGPALAKKKRGGKARGIQFGKVGQMTLSGSASYSSGERSTIIEGDEEGDPVELPSTFSFSPRVGYFVWANKGMALELAGALSFTRSDAEDSAQSTLSFMLDPSFYLKSMKRRGLFPFAHVGVGYANMGMESKGQDDVSLTGLELRPGVGLNFCIGKKRGAFIRTELNYEMLTLTDEDDNGYSQAGPALRVGFGAFF